MATADNDQATRFRAMVLPLLAYLNRLGVALTGNRQAAEDLVQESVLRGLRYFDTFRGDDFKAWMATIMRNLHRSKRAPAPAGVDDEWLQQIPDPALNAEQTVLARESDARLRGLVAALPEALREVLVLREFGELSYAQIASTLEMPVGTVMSRLSRARDNLRAAWLAGE
ncbi:MAG TPA: sigma-70 family RNA polymerase sigma factor [Beijerinckiaceae bacterium]|nr:sigma-70 family RNA polymerase sigma factor [Beijerinckiaceae bacterium]